MGVHSLSDEPTRPSTQDSATGEADAFDDVGEPWTEPCCNAVRLTAFSSFFRRFPSPAPHRWQKGQDLPFPQPGSFHAKAQGLQPPER
mmetsp:Transcript_7128/g.20181  ORF Transcript_7128/g.20181 Transcript_7128/m.20181 type:complete len:88 (+) Transcript_7128:482-745(+)